jgi:hypothetical protein
MNMKPAAPAEKPMTNKQGRTKGTDLEHADLEIAVKMGTKLLLEAGGLQAIEKAINGSGDPAQAISKFLVQLIMQIKEAVSAQGVELSPKIVLAKGGWVDQMLDVIEGELGLPPEFSDQVFGDVIETFKALVQGQQAQQQGGQPQPGAPAPAGNQPVPPGTPIASGGGY